MEKQESTIHRISLKDRIGCCHPVKPPHFSKRGDGESAVDGGDDPGDVGMARVGKMLQRPAVSTEDILDEAIWVGVVANARPAIDGANHQEAATVDGEVAGLAGYGDQGIRLVERGEKTVGRRVVQVGQVDEWMLDDHRAMGVAHQTGQRPE